MKRHYRGFYFLLTAVAQILAAEYWSINSVKNRTDGRICAFVCTLCIAKANDTMHDLYRVAVAEDWRMRFFL